MSDHGDAYRGARARLTTLLRELSDDELERTVPATPAWRVRDVYGHLIGLSADVMDRNTAGAGTDEWTTAQVDARRDAGVDALIAEWDARGPELEGLLDKIKPGSAASITGDIAAHEADIRGALGRTDGRDTDLARLGFEGYVQSLGARIAAAGLPALRVGDLVAGEGEPAASVEGDRFELFRALTGRRSADQIRAYAWTGDAEPYVAIFSAYGWPDAAIVE